jgi:ATP-dependent RNA helicase DeaD
VTDCTPSDAPATGFGALGLEPRLVASLTEHGYAEPTPIQERAIPPLLEGKDLVGLAATGTGKTAAFALPIVQRLAGKTSERGKPLALVLVPTRELAIQVAGAVERYGKPNRLRVLAVYGGSPFGDQARALRHGIDVVVATPGRALDHLRRGSLALDAVAAVVLDEADEMLDMGFADDLEAILSATPPARQTMLFSATMPPRIAAIADKYLTDPVRVAVAKPAPAAGEAPKVRQTVFVVPRDFKIAALARVIEYESPRAALVFCRTRQEAESVADALAARGHRPEALHGGLSQEHRDRVMGKFRDEAVTLLVATDVAARGLDIGHLSHVINFGVPQAAESYIHRIGRVGRAGREGVAITIAEPREQGGIRSIERAAGRRLDPAPVPTAADLRAKRLEKTREELIEIIRAGNTDEFQNLLASLLGEFSVADISLAAVALAAKAAIGADPGPDIPEVMPRRHDRPGFRDDRASSRVYRPRPGLARLFVGAGREAGVGRREIVAVFGDQVGIGPRDLGNIEVAERFCLVEVPEEIADQAIEVLDGVRMRGRRVNVRRDRAGEPPGDRDWRPRRSPVRN